MKYFDKVLLNLGKSSNFFFRNFSINCLKFGNIKVAPKHAFLAEAPKIVVSDLEPYQKVTLWNTYVDDIGLEFFCNAHYVADFNGVVDVTKDPSLGGKYKGIFAEGLVSCMHASISTYKDKPKLKWARLFKQDVTTAMKYHIKVLNEHLSEEELYNRKSMKELSVIDESNFERFLMKEGVKRIEVEYESLRGVLFLPSGNGPFGAVLDIFGAESGIKEHRSAMLASCGFASLVLPYYNYKDIPKLKDYIDLEYFMKAIEFLSNHPLTTNNGICVVGSSKGGEIGILLATLSDKIKALVTINSYHISADIEMRYKGNVIQPSFRTDKNKMDSYICEAGKLHAPAKHDEYTMHNELLLPTEKIKADCEVLLVAGDDEGGLTYKSVTALKDRAYYNKKKNVSILVYPRAGHLIDPPFHSHIDSVWNSTILVRDRDGKRYEGLPHYYGGDAYHTCEASKDLWKRMLTIFYRKLLLEK